MPRVKVRKRKVVHILVKRSVDLSGHIDSTGDIRELGKQTRDDICMEMGRKVLEFADRRISHTGPFRKEIAYLLAVVDRGDRRFKHYAD